MRPQCPCLFGNQVNDEVDFPTNLLHPLKGLAFSEHNRFAPLAKIVATRSRTTGIPLGALLPSHYFPSNVSELLLIEVLQIFRNYTRLVIRQYLH